MPAKPVEVVALAVVASFLLLFALARRQTKGELAGCGMWAVVGKMGSGKTYLMCWAACRAIQRGRRVYGNMHLKGMIKVTTWQEVLDVPSGSMVCLDEAHLWWPSDNWKVPLELAAWVSQLRKRNILLLWDTQDWAFVSRRMRRLTFGVWEARKLGAKRHVYSLYNTGSYDQSSASRPERLGRMVVRRRKRYEDAYDTLELVVPVDDVEEWASAGKKSVSGAA